MGSIRINRWASSIEPSATLSISAKANALRAAGNRVLNFAAGQPDFKPPQAVTDHVRARLADSAVGYAPVPGTPALRELVAENLEAFHGRPFSPEEILVSCGGKHSLANLFMVTLEPEDEVVLFAPYWVSYPEQVKLGGGIPVIVDCPADQGFRPTPEALEAALTDKTRFVVLNSPSNPTGVGLSAEEIRALGEVMVRKAPQAYLVTDDIYRNLVYGGFVAHSAIRLLADLTDQIIAVEGVSKTYAMTGYRIGFLAGPKALIDAGKAIQGQMTSGASTPAQWAAEAALREPSSQQAAAEMLEAFSRRRNLMLGGLRTAKNLSVVEPEGAFYVFPDVSAAIQRHPTINDDVTFATWLLEKHLVATVPGSAFGAPGHLRLSFATDDASIEEGCRRIKMALL